MIKNAYLQGLLGKHSGEISDLQTQLNWTLRITAALCFIGHGTWGLITKAGWLPFFASQGVDLDIAWTLQPIIGAFDITMAIMLLWKPRRAILMWMFLWALWTAILRPLAGNLEKVKVDGEWTVQLATDSMNVPKMQTWEFWERAGNWGPPFMLLVMAGTFTLAWKDWFKPYVEPLMKESTVDMIFFLCRICLAALLIGHAGFGFAVEKQMLIDHWQSIGVNADVEFIRAIGWAEFALGIIVLAFPVCYFIWAALIWKLFTEFLYVPADTVTGKGFLNIFEWIERWGDYGIPAAMLLILAYKKAKPKLPESPTKPDPATV
ncbi:MAG: hypothetical protein AAFY98_10670 [Verrucomicrobiota bacterium]